MAKVGIALGGGGSRGAYQAGVYRALLECGIEYNIVTGTSVGALTGAMMVQHDYDKTVALWLSISASDISNVEHRDGVPGTAAAIFAEFLKTAVSSGGIDISGFESIIRAAVDEERFFASGVDYGLVTVQYPTLKPVIMKKIDLPPGRVCDYMVASASCFPAFPTKLIDDERFIDGGYHDTVPVNLAAELGADEIIAVDLHSVGLRQPQKRRDVKVTTISPYRSLGPFLLFDQDVIRRNMDYGYLDALRAFGRAEGEYLTLATGETKKLYDQLTPNLLGVTQLLEVVLSNTFWEALFSVGEHQKPQYEKFFVTVQRLAEWYSLDCREIYSAHLFCYELLLRVNADYEASPDVKEISQELKAALTRSKSLSEALSRFGRRPIVGHIFSLLQNLKFERGSSQELVPIMAALRQETAAAMFIFALKEHLADEDNI